MSIIAISAEGLSKRYRLGSTVHYGRLTESLWNTMAVPARRLRRGQQQVPAEREVWALRDVSFEVREGDSIGIIGRNGAGKSTLLKILSRITAPTEGRATVRGHVGSLLEVGTGFHPELTGRDNVFLNGSVLGMSRTEIKRRFDEIVEFAEIGAFLDTPVKRYSTGMQLRLAFAVAAHINPEILVIDEVLAVGDAAFQRKCLGKMSEIGREGRTILFVSHNLAAVENICRTGVVLEGGVVAYGGDIQSSIAHYLATVDARTAASSLHDRLDRRGSGQLRVVAIEVRTLQDGRVGSTVRSGDDVEILFHYEAEKGFTPSDLHVGLRIFTQAGTALVNFHNRLTGDTFEQIPPQGVIVCSLPKLPLTPSVYRIDYGIRRAVESDYCDLLEDALRLTVVDGDYYGTGEVPPHSSGIFLVDGSWRVEN